MGTSWVQMVQSTTAKENISACKRGTTLQAPYQAKVVCATAQTVVPVARNVNIH